MFNGLQTTILPKDDFSERYKKKCRVKSNHYETMLGEVNLAISRIDSYLSIIEGSYAIKVASCGYPTAEDRIRYYYIERKQNDMQIQKSAYNDMIAERNYLIARRNKVADEFNWFYERGI